MNLNSQLKKIGVFILHILERDNQAMRYLLSFSQSDFRNPDGKLLESIKRDKYLKVDSSHRF